jgi:hypothetical protein
MIPYLLASLPTPRLGERPEIGLAEFVERCRGFVSEQQWKDLNALLGPWPTPKATPEVPDTRDPATLAWMDLSDQLEDAVARQRAARAKRDPSDALREPFGYRVDVAEGVAQAFSLPHPAARERALDELRWRLADELALSGRADFAELFSRAVQLRLAWRWDAWDEAEGWTALEAALRQIEDVNG